MISNEQHHMELTLHPVLETCSSELEPEHLVHHQMLPPGELHIINHEEDANIGRGNINITFNSEKPTATPEFMTELKIEQGVPPIDEIKLIVSLGSGVNVKLQRQMILCYFNLVCCLAIDGLSKDDLDIFNNEKCIQACANFDEIIENYPKDPFAIQHVFHALPGQTWPAGFLAFCDNFKNQKPRRGWILHRKTIMSMDPSDQHRVYTGSRIFLEFKEAKLSIASFLNSAWKNVLNPGETLSGLLLALRKNLWIVEAEKRGEIAVRRTEIEQRKKIKRTGSSVRKDLRLEGTKGVSEEYIPLSETEKLELFEKKKSSFYRKMTCDWYPKFWIVFLVMGIPSGPEKCSPNFGISVEGLRAVSAKNEGIPDKVNRGSRRKISRQPLGPRNNLLKASDDGKAIGPVKRSFDSDYPKRKSDVDKEIANIEKQLKILAELNDDSAIIRRTELSRELVTLLEVQRYHIRKRRIEKTSEEEEYRQQFASNSSSSSSSSISLITDEVLSSSELSGSDDKDTSLQLYL